MKTLNKNAPLSIEIKGNKLVISIGISTLAFAALYENGGIDCVEKITDESQWAKDVLKELDGGGIEDVLDQAMIRAVEGGSEAAVIKQ